MEDPTERAVEDALQADLQHAAAGDWAALGLDPPDSPAPAGFAPASIDDLLNP